MKNILFACTENKKRSQLAEAIFNHLAKKINLDVHASSAGTIPAQATDPSVRSLLLQHGIDYTNHPPQKLTDEMLTAADYIISFGCLIPDLFPKEKSAEWLVADPHTNAEYEAAFQTILQKVEDLQARLIIENQLQNESQ